MRILDTTDKSTEIADRYAAAKNARAEAEKAWETALRYYKGDIFRLRGQTLSALRRRVRGFVSNDILNAANVLMAKLLSRPPVFGVLPATDDDIERETAQAAERLLDYLWQESAMNIKLHEYAAWLVWSGNAFLFVHHGDVINQTLVDEEGTVIEDNAVLLDVLSPYEVLQDPHSTSIDGRDADWIMRVIDMKMDEAKDRWGDKVHGGYEPVTSEPEQETIDERITVLELYTRKTRTEGARIYRTTIDGAILEKEDGYPHGELPIIKTVYHYTGDTWGMSPVTAAVPIQKNIDYFFWKYLHALDLLGDPAILVPEGAVETTPFTNEPGNVIS